MLQEVQVFTDPEQDAHCELQGEHKEPLITYPRGQAETHCEKYKYKFAVQEVQLVVDPEQVKHPYVAELHG